MRGQSVLLLLLLAVFGLTVPQFEVVGDEPGEILQIQLVNSKGDEVTISTTDENPENLNAFNIAKNGKNVLSYSQVESGLSGVSGTFTSDSDLRVSEELSLIGANDSLVFRGQKQWKLVNFNDFQVQKSGWSIQTIASCGKSENIFLGGHCNLAGGTISKTYVDLPIHSLVRVSFNIHFFDDWNGEFAFAKANGQIMWQESYAWCQKLVVSQCKVKGINACGKDTPDKMNHHVEFTVQHNSVELQLEIGSNIIRSPCDVSWGIDDVSIYVL